ncbi:unnamed protein product [Cochlearia groenlandica]
MQPLNFFFNHTEYASYSKLSSRCDPWKAVETIRRLGPMECRWHNDDDANDGRSGCDVSISQEHGSSSVRGVRGGQDHGSCK